MSSERFIRTEERRAFPRWPAEFELSYGESTGETARVIDISETGLVFSAQKSFPVGTEIDLRCWIGPADGNPIQIKAIVRRNEQGTVALEFMNLRRTDRLRILDAGIVQLAGRAGAAPNTPGPE